VAPPDLRRIVRRFEVDLVRRRFGASELTSSGLRRRGLPSDTEIRAVVWHTDEATDRAQHGQQDVGSIGAVSRFELLSAQTAPTGVPDVLIWGGAFYEVDRARPWHRAGAVAQFWEVEARRVELELGYPAAVAFGPGIALVVT
jgi:hypothetical protein